MTVRSATSVWISEHKYFRVSARARERGMIGVPLRGARMIWAGKGQVGLSWRSVQRSANWCRSWQRDSCVRRAVRSTYATVQIRWRRGRVDGTQTDACGQKQQQQVILTGSPRRARSMTEWRRDPAPMHNHVPCGAVQQTRPGRQGEEPRLQPVRRERRGEEIGSGQVREDRRSRADVGQVATPKVVSRY